jgi:hypothetical protein
MTDYYREFPQPDGSVKICEARDGVRLPTRYVRPGAKQVAQTAPPKKEPRRIEPKRTLAQKAATFAKSAARHIAAGLPQATDEQVAERFAVCQACPHFIPKSDGQGECSKCGCGLKAVGVSGLNKLRWADESCPVKRWGPIALPPAPPAE